jgi:hypothetical protein
MGLLRSPPPSSSLGGSASSAYHSSAFALAAKKRSSPTAFEASVEESGGSGGAQEYDDVGDGDLSSMKGNMAKHVDYAKREFTKVRGSIASAAMLDHITVNAYGEKHPMTAMAQVALKGANALVVSPFDSSVSF